MELKIYSPTEDGFIKTIDWNHEEIKQQVESKVAMYKNLVYTDDQIKEAKSDKAKLNKFVTALEDKRKEIKKQCLEPYEAFEKQMKEIVSIVNEPIQLIDSQVKAYEEKRKEEKKLAIEELFEKAGFQAFVTLEKIFDEKWLNSSVSMSKIEEQMKELIFKIGNDVLVLTKLPEYSFEALEVYKSTLDMNKAVFEANKMSETAKKKAEFEAEQAKLKAEYENTQAAKLAEKVADVNISTENVAPVQIEPSRQWISFKANLTTKDALALKDFFVSRNIEFKAI